MSPILKGLKRPSVAMVFSGQGAQWAQMGNELLTTDYRFRGTFGLWMMFFTVLNMLQSGLWKVFSLAIYIFIFEIVLT